MDQWGESQSASAQGRFERPTCRSTLEHAHHQTTMTAHQRPLRSLRIHYTPGPQRGGHLLPIGGIICENRPATRGGRDKLCSSSLPAAAAEPVKITHAVMETECSRKDPTQISWVGGGRVGGGGRFPPPPPPYQLPPHISTPFLFPW